MKNAIVRMLRGILNWLSPQRVSETDRELLASLRLFIEAVNRSIQTAKESAAASKTSGVRFVYSDAVEAHLLRISARIEDLPALSVGELYQIYWETVDPTEGNIQISFGATAVLLTAEGHRMSISKEGIELRTRK